MESEGLSGPALPRDEEKTKVVESHAAEVGLIRGIRSAAFGGLLISLFHCHLRLFYLSVSFLSPPAWRMRGDGGLYVRVPLPYQQNNTHLPHAHTHTEVYAVHTAAHFCSSEKVSSQHPISSCSLFTYEPKTCKIRTTTNMEFLRFPSCESPF